MFWAIHVSPINVAKTRARARKTVREEEGFVMRGDRRGVRG
jgi:hypothetical protein